MKQPAQGQVGGIADKPVLLGIFRAADRQHELIHQRVDGKPLQALLIEIEGQIDAITMQVDVLVAGDDIELDLRMQAGEISQPGHQPALGDEGRE